MKTTQVGLKADTYGWDTAFAIRVDDVNAAIKRRSTSPKTFSALTEDPHTHKRVTVNGHFDDWQITLGGSGKLIHMSTPVTRLVASGTSEDGTPLRFTYEQGSFEIQIELEYVPHTDPPANSNGTFHNLKVKHTGPTPHDRVVTVLGAYHFGSSTDADHLSFDAISDDVQAAMQIWFNSHLIDFEHVFATVNLNRTADKGQFQWLLPTYTSYAYIDGDTLDNSILGILCMTENRSPTGLNQEISPNAIPSGSRSGFLISPERFISQMLWPSMPLVYKGVRQDNFKMRVDNTGLILANGPVTIESMKDGDGVPHTTILQNFELSTANETLMIDATTKVEVSPGIHAFTHNVVSYNVELHKLNDGTGTLYYVQHGKATTEHWTQESEGVQLAKILEGVVAGLITVAIGVLTGGAGFAIASVVIGVLAGIAADIPDMIATTNTDESPSVSLLIFNAVDPLQWSDQKDFYLDQVALNYALQMGGITHFGELQAHDE